MCICACVHVCLCVSYFDYPHPVVLGILPVTTPRCLILRVGQRTRTSDSFFSASFDRANAAYFGAHDPLGSVKGFSFSAKPAGILAVTLFPENQGVTPTGLASVYDPGFDLAIGAIPGGMWWEIYLLGGGGCGLVTW